MSPQPTEISDPRATVVGGGPAGLMAAEVLANAGLKVTIFDHMRSVGRKLLLAGRGGLNITHSEELESFLGRYGPDRDRLVTAFNNFGPDELRSWCDQLGETTFVGSSGRVFPKSFKATPLLRAWLRRLDSQGVEFRTGHRWVGWGRRPDGSVDGSVSRFERSDGTAVDVEADVTVMALGGASWPRSGSDGSWVREFVECGIGVAALRPANCGVRFDWSEHFVDRFAGVPLKNVSVSVSDHATRGDIMVTETGLEGGPVYAHSREVRRQLDQSGRCMIRIDLQPDLTTDQLVDRLAVRRRSKDSMSTWLRRAGFSKVAVGVLREATANELPRGSSGLASLVKGVPLDVTGVSSIDRAISTAGGVMFDEIDEAFMLHRIPGVFLAGEMLDWEAPTGGYLLQASISTAVAAANGAVRSVVPTAR